MRASSLWFRQAGCRYTITELVHLDRSNSVGLTAYHKKICCGFVRCAIGGWGRMSELVLSVVIVTFESQDDISNCIRSVLDSDVPLEIIVIDNSSRDRTVDR